MSTECQKCTEVMIMYQKAERHNMKWRKITPDTEFDKDKYYLIMTMNKFVTYKFFHYRDDGKFWVVDMAICGGYVDDDYFQTNEHALNYSFYISFPKYVGDAKVLFKNEYEVE